MQVTNADVLIPTTGKVDGQVIRSAPKLKLIVQSATGYSNIDIETAGQLGIPVCNSPGQTCFACTTYALAVHTAVKQLLGSPVRPRVCREIAMISCS